MSFNFIIKSVNHLEELKNKRFQIKLLNVDDNINCKNLDIKGILKQLAYDFELNYHFYLQYNHNQYSLDKYKLPYGLLFDFDESECIIINSDLFIPIIPKNKYIWFQECFSIDDNINLGLTLEININQIKKESLFNRYEYSYHII